MGLSVYTTTWTLGSICTHLFCNINWGLRDRNAIKWVSVACCISNWGSLKWLTITARAVKMSYGGLWHIFSNGGRLMSVILGVLDMKVWEPLTGVQLYSIAIYS